MGGVVVDLPGLNAEQQGVCHGGAHTKKLWMFATGNPPLRALLIIPSPEIKFQIFSLPSPYKCILYSNVHQLALRVGSEKSFILKYKCSHW